MNPKDLGTVFYPSCVVHFLFRFDETLQVAESKADLVSGLDIDTSSLASATARLASQAVLAGHVIEAAITELGDKPAPVLRPLVYPADGMSPITNRVPQKATIELPGLRQAGKFSLSFKYLDLPIDPRLVRACSVEIHLGTVGPSAFGRGMLGGQKSPGGQIESIMSTRNAEGTANDDTMIMYGTVDNWSVEHDESGSTISMDGRDLRGLLLDAKVPMQKMADLQLDKPIDEVVKAILHTLPSEVDLSLFVICNQEEWGGVIPSPVDKDGLTRVRLKADGAGTGQSSGAGAGQDKLSYWDIITRYTGLVGAVPYFRGQYLWIRPARRLYDMLENPKTRTPFADGEARTVTSVGSDGAAIVEKIRIRRLVYGRNISKLSYERKFAQACPIVEVVSLDDSVRGEGKLLLAQWPPKGSLAAILKGDTDETSNAVADPTGAAPKSSSNTGGANRTRINVPGIRSMARLTAIAQDIYEEIGRGEMGGNCSTRALTSFGGDSLDPDMLRLRPSDGVEFLVDKRALASRPPLAAAQLIENTQMPFEALVQKVAGTLQGGRSGQKPDTNLARVLVATARSAIVDSMRFFRVSNVKYNWAASVGQGGGGGVDIAFDFQNYVVPRHKASTAPEPKYTANAKVTPVQIQGDINFLQQLAQQFGVAAYKKGISRPGSAEEGHEFGVGDSVEEGIRLKKEALQDTVFNANVGIGRGLR